jgi:hypothetical protein
LEGDITFYYPKAAPKTVPCSGEIEDGRLKLSWDKGNGSADLRLYKKDDGSMELKGTSAYKGTSASVVFKKVK